MGLFKRLHRITVARIEAFLDRVEDPEVVFPQLVKEMEEQLQNATQAEAKSSAALKAAQRGLDKNDEQLQKLRQGAVLAMKNGDESTARDAVVAQIDLEKSITQSQENVDRAQITLGQATTARKKIQQELEELHSKKNEILTRARVARTQRKIQQSVSGSAGSTDSILDAVARLETSVEELEAELEIQARLAGEDVLNPSLERRLQELSQDNAVEQRLAQLRNEISSGAAVE